MVEVITNVLEDTLIDGVSFKLAKTAPYITYRRSCACHPQGSNIYMSNAGIKLLKITIAGLDWLDPSRCRKMFDLVNTDNAAGHKLRLISGPWSLFNRMIIVNGGQILENIDMYNPVHDMFIICTAENSMENAYAEGFANYWENVVDASHRSDDHLKGTPASSTQNVCSHH